MRPWVFYLWCFYANTNYQHRTALRGIKPDLEFSTQRYVILQAISFQEIDHRSPKLVFERSVQNQAEGKKAIIISKLISWVYWLKDTSKLLHKATSQPGIVNHDARWLERLYEPKSVLHCHGQVALDQLREQAELTHICSGLWLQKAISTHPLLIFSVSITCMFGYLLG